MSNINIRPAVSKDAVRIAEVEIFNYRLNFYPVFRNDYFYFAELNVLTKAESNMDHIENMWVYDDGVVKGFICIYGREVRKLFVEPVLQSLGIGSELLKFAIEKFDTDRLWVLEKNIRAISFYERHGFNLTEEKKYEEGTTENLILMKR